jgi:hypothetical protein
MYPDEDEKERRIAYRLRILPQQLVRARRRYWSLVAEAKELRMYDLLEVRDVDPREIERAAIVAWLKENWGPEIHTIANMIEEKAHLQKKQP